jgi:TonB family protein
METSPQSGAGIPHTGPDTEKELNLLLVRDEAGDRERWRRSYAGSVAFHFLLFTVLWFVKEEPYQPLPPERTLIAHVTPLYIPPELTQKAPNRKPVSKELALETIAPRPAVRTPAPAPAPPPRPTPEVARPTPQPVIEPPKIEAPAPGVQLSQIPKATIPTPPPPSEPPKLALQDATPYPQGSGIGRGRGLIQVPGSSVQEAIRGMGRPGGALGSQSVGDAGTEEGAVGAGLNLPPSAGRPQSSLELKSDPMGVDFKPYMTQVIAAIRRNWFAVYPEAARLGQRGQVVLQFAVAKQGVVTKVVFSGASGAKALDQSAVAAISASNPLPPLPTEFKGDRIVLQMTFLYNMPR